MRRTAYKQWTVCCLLLLGLMGHWSDNVIAQNVEQPLRVALTGKYPPFSYYGEDGQLAGFDVDVSREIAKRLGREILIIATEWDGILSDCLLINTMPLSARWPLLPNVPKL